MTRSLSPPTRSREAMIVIGLSPAIRHASIVLLVCAAIDKHHLSRMASKPSRK